MGGLCSAAEIHAVDLQEWLASGNPGPTARNFLTEPTLRRLSRLPLDDALEDGVL